MADRVTNTSYVKWPTFDEIKEMFKEHFIMERREDGVVTVRMHTRGGPLIWSSENTMTFLDGKTVKYRAYENIHYVTKPEASYNDKGTVPIFFKTNVGGYMASDVRRTSPVTSYNRAIEPIGSERRRQPTREQEKF